jgi:hypothetical protein
LKLYQSSKLLLAEKAAKPMMKSFERRKTAYQAFVEEQQERLRNFDQ